LRRASERVLKGNSYWGFAGFCAMIMLSCAVAGLAMTTNGQNEVTDLVAHDGQYKWQVCDREVFPDPNGAFHVRKPIVTDNGIAFPLNTVVTGDAKSLFTVYMVWDGKIDLSGKSTITAVVNIYGEDAEFAYRDLDYPYDPVVDDSSLPFFRMHFMSTTGDSWTCSDYWWSCASGGYGYFTGAGTYTITASLAPTGTWSDRDGHLNTAETDLYLDALTDVDEIGLSFGGGSGYANGVGVVSGSATFELASFSIV